ncbi:hypothetical protein GE107_16130 [Cohnella sp. CFH 77786]|uniref:Hcp family type VI secretion system effector n=1 Tax=Cohnella sp. CFH 77786 TaxID=2662265 RepID=UPI001C60F944|nr:type VI secretion system tube protein Hcp [Cohnella sp. CFH 77786]MBW5447586.1 hypothetical protein [Cohnella sp. CFH 77786]
MLRFKRFKPLFILLTAAALIFALPVSASAAGTRLFLVLDGIKGDSTDARLRDAIELRSFDFNVAKEVCPCTNAEKTKFHDIVITKSIDSASLPLLERAATGQKISNGVLYFQRGSVKQPTFLKIKFTNLTITGYHLQENEGSDTSFEQITFRAEKMVWEYSPQKLDGSSGLPIKVEIDTANPSAK